MSSQILRIALASLAFLGSVALIITSSIGWGILAFLLAGLIVLTYFRNERILIAFYHLRKQRFDQAKKSLSAIKDPEKDLIKGQRAYFYFLNGLLEAQNNLGKSETFMRKALNTGLRMKHDQAMAKLNLAGIAVARRRRREAELLLSEVKKLDERGLLTEQVKLIKQQLKHL